MLSSSEIDAWIARQLADVPPMTDEQLARLRVLFAGTCSQHGRRRPGGGMTTAVTAIVVGSRVRIERDETLYPARGTWPQFRGRTGTVVEINADKRPHLTEYGVIFGKVTSRTDGKGSFNWSGAECPTWFKAHEITSRGGSQRDRGRMAR